MSALRSSNRILIFNESASKFNNNFEKATPVSTKPLSRNKQELFADLDSFRNDLRKQINDKLKIEEKIPKNDVKGVSPLRVHDSNKGDREQTSAIYNDLLSAMRGAPSNKGRTSLAKENIQDRTSSMNQDAKSRMTEARPNPLEELSKNLFSLKNPVNTSKENLRPSTLGTPLIERNKKGAPPTSKILGSKANWQCPTEDTSSNSITMCVTAQTPRVGSDSTLSRISIGQNRTPISKKEEPCAGSLLGLSQELEQIRSQNRKEFAPNSIETVLLNQNPARASHQTTRASTHRLFRNVEEPNTGSFFNENARVKSSAKKKDVTEAIPLVKLYELQSAISDANNEEIDNLPEQYVEGLVKLSSAIMYRIKTSKHYASQLRA